MTNPALDETKKYAPKSLGRVLILGLGKSGKAASNYCADLLGSRVESLEVYAGSKNDDALAFAAELESKGATVIFEKQEFDSTYDLCISSPGISEFSDFYLNAAAAAGGVISEVEFAWRESAADSVWVAITGTNGKTTTTALAAHLFQAFGKNAYAVGNIGDTCIDRVALNAKNSESRAYYIAEVSSYQLASTKMFKPDAAVLLNITPDHIKWHKTHEAYCAAKRKVYANCASGDAVILDATNDEVRSYVKQIKSVPGSERGFAYIPMGTKQGIYSSMIDACGSENAAYAQDDKMVVVYDGQTYDLGKIDSLLIKGEHNVSNAIAACCTVIACLGKEMPVPAFNALIQKGLHTFAPLEHRIEPCGTVEGVACYNDSKATNVDATLKALSAFGEKKPIVLFGGDDKGTDLTELVNEAEIHCKAVVCFGAAGPRFYEACTKSDILPVYSAGNMESALDEALSHAQSGDIVVLSPACASFDEFNSFEHRGKVFKELVAKRAEIRGA